MQLPKRRALVVGILLMLLAAITAAPALARPRPPRPVPPRPIFTTVTVSATITAVDATAKTLGVTDRNGFSATLQTTSTTVITRDGKTATLADLKVNDNVLATFNRNTLVASRIQATSPPPVEVTGTITALNTGTVQVTTDHGTAVTVTTNTSTVVRLNGSVVADIGPLALGFRVSVVYRPADKIALRLSAETPNPNVVSGKITNIASSSLQLTPLVGDPQTITVNAQTQYRLNGRLIASNRVALGQLATARLSNGVATLVSAETPLVVDLVGTISAVDTTNGTIEVTTASMTTITLDVTSTTTMQLNGAMITALGDLHVGDRIQVRYEYHLTPGDSVALRIVAARP